MKFIKKLLFSFVFIGLTPIMSFGMDNKKEEIRVSLSEVDEGSDIIIPDSLIPLIGSDQQEIEVPLKWIRYSVTLENLLKDTGIVLEKENEKYTIQEVPVSNIKGNILDFIFNQLVPELANDSLDLSAICQNKEISFVVDLILAINYLDIKNGLLKKLIDYCAERISNDPEKNDINQRLKDIPPVLLRLLCKALARSVLYSIKVEKPLAVCKGHDGVVNSVCALETEEGIRIISGSSDAIIRIWDMSGNQLARCDGHKNIVNSVCTLETEKGIRIISASDDETVCIWDMSGNQLAVCNGHAKGVLSVCAIEGEEGIRIISGSYDNTVRIWDMNGDQLAVCNGHTQSVLSVCAIETEGEIRIISSSDDGTVRIWDMSGNELVVCNGNTGIINSVCVLGTKQGIRIISASDDGTVCIWDMSGNQLAVCNGHADGVLSVCAIEAEEGIRIISGSLDNTICIWDMDGNQLVQCVCDGGEDDPYVTSVCVLEAKEGIRIISGSYDTHVRTWNPFYCIEQIDYMYKEKAKEFYKVLFNSLKSQENKKEIYKKIELFFENDTKK